MTSAILDEDHFAVTSSTVRLPPATEQAPVLKYFVTLYISLTASLFPVAAQPVFSICQPTEPIARLITPVDWVAPDSAVQHRATVCLQDLNVSPSGAFLPTCVRYILLIPFLLFGLFGLPIVRVSPLVKPLNLCVSVLLVGKRSR